MLYGQMARSKAQGYQEEEFSTKRICGRTGSVVSQPACAHPKRRSRTYFWL